jgi:hypothetical protein
MRTAVLIFVALGTIGFVIGFIVAVSGCVSIVETPAVAEPGEAPDGPGQSTQLFPQMDRTGTVRRAVVAGLTQVEPRFYSGWDGACPGCDVDASVVALLCREQGLQVAELHNRDVTRGGLMDACRQAWAGMTAGDLLVVFISGHGGQDLDTNADEEDGQDETLCLWDGQLSDDVLGALWQEIPKGVRVLFVTDTCNSGTNYKRRSIRKTVPRNYAGELIHFGGCADGLSSYGSEQGGTWTTALIDAWAPTNSVLGWFEAAAAKMPRRQVPAYAEHGSVSAAFRHGRALR